MEDSTFLNKVYGYNPLKKELKLIYDWYVNGQDKARLPRGILFYGNSGSGKTFVMREYTKLFNCPVYEIKGDDDNLLNEIAQAYQHAKKDNFAIVIIDELDRLVMQDNLIARILQSQMDGFEINQTALTLATANCKDDIPEPLLRQGRFDRIISFDYLCKKDVKDMVVSFLKDFNMTFNDDEIHELSDTFEYNTPCLIKAVIADAYNRKNKCMTIDDVLFSYDLITYNKINTDYDIEVSKQIAIHEAGHAWFLYKYSNTQKFLRVIFNKKGGFTICSNDSSSNELEARYNSIRAALSGIAAEELIRGYHDIGCSSDIDQAYDLSSRLIARTCIKGFKYYFDRQSFFKECSIPEKKQSRLDKETYKLINKEFKYVKSLFKHDKNKILLIANYLCKHKGMSRKEMMKIGQ